MADLTFFHGGVDVKAGECWLLKTADEGDWPVLICDENIVQKHFQKAAKRPGHARKADGTWPKGFGPGCTFSEQRCYPALYLGNLKK